MAFDKDAYWANRRAGKRGQGDDKVKAVILSVEESEARRFRKKVQTDFPDEADKILVEAAEDIRSRANTLRLSDPRKMNLYKAADIVEGRNHENT